VTAKVVIAELQTFLDETANLPIAVRDSNGAAYLPEPDPMHQSKRQTAPARQARFVDLFPFNQGDQRVRNVDPRLDDPRQGPIGRALRRQYPVPRRLPGQQRVVVLDQLAHLATRILGSLILAGLLAAGN
jgi:hypothetical protein